MENKEFTLKFGGTSAMEKDKVSWSDLFEEYYNDDGQFVAFSKEIFDHDPYNEDCYQFKYKLCIKGTAMAAFVCENEKGYNDIHIELYLVPLPEYLCDKKKKDIADCMGTEVIDEYDIVEYGCCPKLDYETVTIEDDVDRYDITEIEIVKRKLDACATTCHCVNNLRGFALDRQWNMIGTTGWDLIDEMINGKDAILTTFERYKTATA